VEVQLQGACSSCAISSDTLQGRRHEDSEGPFGVVTDVVGGVDDSIDPEDSMSLGVGGYVPDTGSYSDVQSAQRFFWM